MSNLDAPMLPSPNLRQYYAQGVVERISKLKGTLHMPVLDGLGDLSLALARRGVHRWVATVEAFASLMEPRWMRAEAATIVEVAIKIGLLVPWHEGLYRPRDIGHVVWLGARRIATTSDQDGLIEHRLNGPLFDIFAMAPSLMADQEAAANLVRSYCELEGPWEDLLESGRALAAAAVCWGATAESELRYELLTRAEDWVMPLGASWNREIGMAVLVREAAGGPFGEEVVALAEARLEGLISEALADEELASNPAILESLNAQIAIVLAGRGPSEELLGALIARLPPQHAHRIGHAVGQILEPGRPRNEALILSASAAAQAGDEQAFGILAGLAEPLADVIGPIHDLFQHLLEYPPGELGTVYQSMAACRAIGHWDTCPELTLHLLSRLVASPRVDPDLRITAAEAMSRHMVAAGRARDILLDTLHGQFELADRAQAIAACAAALHLGSSHIRLGALALAMVADGGPIDILAHALDAGIRQNPMHFAAFEEALQHYLQDEHMQASALAIIAELTDTMQRESSLGPFFTLPPYPDLVRYGLAKILLPLVSDLSRPEFAGDAASSCGWVLRGDLGYALTCLSLREQAPDDRLRALYDLSMGSAGVAEPRVIDRLARDCAYGPPDLSAAAAVSLRVLLDNQAQLPNLDEVLPLIRERAEMPGPQKEPILLFLHQLATLPIEE